MKTAYVERSAGGRAVLLLVRSAWDLWYLMALGSLVALEPCPRSPKRLRWPQRWQRHPMSAALGPSRGRPFTQSTGGRRTWQVFWGSTSILQVHIHFQKRQ